MAIFRETKLVESAISISRNYLNDNSFNISKQIDIKRIPINSITTIYVDDNSKRFAIVDISFISSFHTAKNLRTNIIICDYKDLLKFEIFEDGHSVVSGRVGSALVGGILLGGVGAAMGAAASRSVKSNCTTMQVVLNLNNLQTPVITIDLVNNNTYSLNRNARDLARDISAILTYIQNQETNAPQDDNDTAPSSIVSIHFDGTANSVSTKATQTDTQSPLTERNNWCAFILCLFFGWLGVHKFYEGKIGIGVLYLFTGGLFLIGIAVDLIAILLKPNPYYV